MDIYQLLKSVGFITQKGKVANIAAIKERHLADKIRYYVETISKLEIEVSKVVGLSTLRSPESTKNTLQQVVPNAFFHETVFINDPIPKHLKSQRQPTDSFNKSIGLKPTTNIDRAILRRDIQYLLDLKPLVEIGAIIVLPISYESKSEDIPFFFSEDNFKSLIPENIHDYIHKQAFICPLFPKGDVIAMPKKRCTEPTLGIGVLFDADPDYVWSAMYFLGSGGFFRNHDQIEVKSTFDWGKPVSEEEFKIWCYQSVNRTIINRLADIQRIVSIANKFGASYQTESEFEATLCGMAFNAKPLDQNAKGVNFLNANADKVRIANPAALAKLREGKNAKLFKEWQDSLHGIIDQLDANDEDFNQKANSLFAKEIAPQIREFESRANNLFYESCRTVLATGGTMAFAIYTKFNIPLMGVLAAGVVKGSKLLTDVSSYVESRKGPAFIWSKLSK